MQPCRGSINAHSSCCYGSKYVAAGINGEGELACQLHNITMRCNSVTCFSKLRNRPTSKVSNPNRCTVKGYPYRPGTDGIVSHNYAIARSKLCYGISIVHIVIRHPDITPIEYKVLRRYSGRKAP